MEINIPFTKKSIFFKRISGGSVCNGNGFSHKSIQIGVGTIHGNGDCGLLTIHKK